MYTNFSRVILQKGVLIGYSMIYDTIQLLMLITRIAYEFGNQDSVISKLGKQTLLWDYIES